jgi:hypothetical protein
MWALVEDGSITKIINKPRGMVIDNIQYSRNIFSFRWSNAEREAIGLYEVVFNNTNKKDEAYYINTDQTFAFADGVVTASFGTATARALADANATDDDGVELDPVVIIEGLKTQHKRIIKNQASGLLIPTDWYVIKATDVESYSVPSAVTTFRTNVRTKSNTMETAIDNAADVDALATLYEYTEQEDGSQTRPLGEWPELEV